MVGGFRTGAGKGLLTLEYEELAPQTLAPLDLFAGWGSRTPTAVTVPEPHA